MRFPQPSASSRTGVTRIGVTALLGVLLAACGSSVTGGSAVQRPALAKAAAATATTTAGQRELAAAARALGRTRSLTTTIHLDTTAATLRNVAAHDFHSPLTATEVQALSAGVVTVELRAPKGKTLQGKPRRDRLRIEVASQGTQYADLEIVHRVAYLRADVTDLAALAGYTIPGAVSALPGVPKFVAALLADKWVSLPLQKVRPLVRMLTGHSATTTKALSRRHLLSAIGQVLRKDVTVTRSSSNNGVDQLTASANARSLASDVVAALVPALGNLVTSQDLASVPDHVMTADATVHSGVLQQFSIDVDQFASSHTASVPLDVGFARSGSAITVPKHAVAVKLRGLESLLGLFSGSGL